MSDESEGADGLDSMQVVARIVVAFVANNSLPVVELPGLIASVDVALRGLAGAAPEAVPPEKLTPVVPIKKSIAADYLICLDDGKKFRSLKRHLGGLGMTPEAYRAKWGLPADYPMVAPNYAAKRSELAKSIGLGRTSKKATAAKRSRKPKASASAEQ